jgi:hypothetical protein
VTWLARSVRWWIVRRCPHEHYFRELRKGRLWLVCDRCWHDVVALERTDDELEQLAARWPPRAPMYAHRPDPPGPTDVPIADT